MGDTENPVGHTPGNTPGDTQEKCITTDVACQTLEDGDFTFTKNTFKHCIKDCKYEGKEVPKKGQCAWVRCCLCVHWYHSECVALPIDETKGIWSCPSCRGIAADVISLKRQVEQLLSIIRQTHLNVTDMMSGQRDLMAAVKFPAASSVPTSTSATNPTPTKTMSLLIGDSLLKDVKSKSDKLLIKSKVPKLQNIKNELQKYQNLENVYIVNGTNDCKTNDDTTEIIEAFRSAVCEAKTRANKVFLSSITPRTDCAEVKTRINVVNQMLVVLSNEE